MNVEDEGDARAIEELERSTSAERQPGEIAVIAIFLGAGVFFLYGARGYPFTTEDGLVGPGAVPITIATLYVIVMTIALVISIRSRPRPAAAAATTSPVARVLAGSRAFGINRDLLIVVGVLGVSLVAVPILGLIPALAVMSFICSWVVGRKKWWSSLIVTAGAALVTHLVFVTLLRVPLPQPLDFL